MMLKSECHMLLSNASEKCQSVLVRLMFSPSFISFILDMILKKKRRGYGRGKYIIEFTNTPYGKIVALYGHVLILQTHTHIQVAD